MRLRLFITLLTIAIALPLATTIRATPATLTMVYVDAVNGSNLTGDGSAGNPWKTISYALTQVVTSHTILIEPGIYNTELGETFPISVSSGIKLIGSGIETTIIEGQSNQPVLYIGSAANDIFSNTQISALTAQNGSSGLYLEGVGHVLEPLIDTVRFFSNTTGVSISGSNGATVIVTLSNTQAMSNTQSGISAISFGAGAPSTVIPVIINSSIQNNSRYGININSSSNWNGNVVDLQVKHSEVNHNDLDGIEISSSGGGNAYIHIDQSWLTDNVGFGMAWDGDSYGTFGGTITNTVIAVNQLGGLHLAQGAFAAANGILYINSSTIYNNRNFGIDRDYDRAHLNNVLISMTNSIVWNDNAQDLYNSDNTEWSVNEIQFTDIKNSSLVGEQGNFSKNPLILDNYHLSPCSPAIDTGTNLHAPQVDLDGDPRPAGIAPDVGADEQPLPCLLNISKQVSTDHAKYGEFLTYTIGLTNTASVTPLKVLLTDVLPSALRIEPNTLQASQGIAEYASGIMTWSDTIAPQTVATISLQAQIALANHIFQNSVLADAGSYGMYPSVAVTTYVEPVHSYLPIILNNSCTAPTIDDFSNSNSGWPIADTSYWSFGYSNNEYRFLAKTYAFGAVTRGERQNGYLIVEVDTRQVSTVNGSMGILFGLNDNWSILWTFEIYPATHEFAVFEFYNGQWIRVIQGASSVIKSDHTTNRLRVELSPMSDIDVFVNGTHLYSYRLISDYFSTQRVGLTATSDWSTFDVRFDNYKFVTSPCPENPLIQLNATARIGPETFDTMQLPSWSERLHLEQSIQRHNKK